MDGEVEVIEKKRARFNQRRVKIWVAGLATMGVLYVPQTPIFLKILGGDAEHSLLPGLPALAPAVWLSRQDAVTWNIPDWIWFLAIYVLTFFWAGSLIWLSAQNPRRFWDAIFLSLVASIFSGVYLYFDIF